MYFSEDEGSDARRNSQLWSKHFKYACDDLARRKYCYFMRIGADIEAAQLEYCIPPTLFYPQAISVYSSAGNLIVPMQCYTPSQMDGLYPYWRTLAAQTGTALPTIIVREGLQRFKIYMTPNYDSAYDVTTNTGGVVFEGFGIPGDIWNGTTDQCPLPDWSQEAVLYGAMLNRFRERPPKTSGEQWQHAEFTKYFRNLTDQVESLAASYGDACRGGGYGSLSAPYYGYFG